jgi:hypothetical protein
MNSSTWIVFNIWLSLVILGHKNKNNTK